MICIEAETIISLMLGILSRGKRGEERDLELKRKRILWAYEMVKTADVESLRGRERSGQWAWFGRVLGKW